MCLHHNGVLYLCASCVCVCERDWALTGHYMWKILWCYCEFFPIRTLTAYPSHCLKPAFREAHFSTWCGFTVTCSSGKLIDGGDCKAKLGWWDVGTQANVTVNKDRWTLCGGCSSSSCAHLCLCITQSVQIWRGKVEREWHANFWSSVKQLFGIHCFCVGYGGHVYVCVCGVLRIANYQSAGPLTCSWYGWFIGCRFDECLKAQSR